MQNKDISEGSSKLCSKLIGSTCLIAGTAIGAGMIALPLTLIKIGILPATILMLVIWLMMYYSALINLELNLHAPKGLPLGELGAHYSGPIAKFIGSISILTLTYALLSAYIYGGASVIQKLLQHFIAIEANFHTILMSYAGFLALILLTAISYVDRINRLLFMGLLVCIALAIGFLIYYAKIPPLVESHMSVSAWSIALPVVFTSFGFQVIFHTLTDYCAGNAVILRRAFFWGSLIPALIYILWTSGTIGTLYSVSSIYHSALQSMDVGNLVVALGAVTSSSLFHVLSWSISILAIITSSVGVGLGLLDSWKHRGFHHVLGVFFTVIPGLLIALCVPDAFVKILGFAGYILVVIAILLPLYLLHKANIPNEKLHYKILRHRWLQGVVVIGGLIIMSSDMW